MSGMVFRSEKTNVITVVPKMRDYSQDPFVKKKTENALAFIKKHGLPKASKKKRK